MRTSEGRLSRAEFLRLSGLTATAVLLGTGELESGRAYADAQLLREPVLARRRVGRSAAHLGGPVDPARAGPVRAGRPVRDAARAGPRPLRGGEGRGLPPRRGPRRGDRDARARPLRPRRGPLAAARLRVLLPLQGRRGDQPGRPDADDTGRPRRPAPVRAGRLPALAGGLLHRARRDRRRRGPRPGGVLRRLHLRDRLHGGARTSRSRTTSKSECITLDQYRCRYGLYKTDPGPAGGTPRIRGSSPGTTTRWTTTTRRCSPRAPSRRRRSRPAAPPPTRRTTSTCRCGGRRCPPAPTCRSTAGSRSGGSPSSGCSTGASTAATRPAAASVRRRARSRSTRRARCSAAGQEAWLLDGLHRSRAHWNVLAQQVIMCRADRDPGPGLGPRWTTGTGTRRPASGCSTASRSAASRTWSCSRATPTAAWPRTCGCSTTTRTRRPIGAEIVGTSISSGGDGEDVDERGEEFLTSNPHMRFYNARRGYVSCDVTRELWRSDFRALPYVTQPGATPTTIASFVTLAGVPGLQPA